MQYDSFGNPLAQRGDVVRLPIGFAGGLFDADTGLTRFVWRDYDADTGRFTALDPLREKGGDSDWYGYCVDDPVNRVDVWGLSAIPMPFPILVPPVAVPGTPENNDFTKGTIDILNGIGEFFGGMFGDNDEAPADPNTQQAGHTTNKTPSNLPKHEKGEARRQRQEGKDKKRQQPNWRGNPNKPKRQSDLGDPDDYGMAAFDTTDYDEEAA